MAWLKLGRLTDIVQENRSEGDLAWLFKLLELYVEGHAACLLWVLLQPEVHRDRVVADVFLQLSVDVDTLGHSKVDDANVRRANPCVIAL